MNTYNHGRRRLTGDNKFFFKVPVGIGPRRTDIDVFQ